MQTPLLADASTSAVEEQNRYSHQGQPPSVNLGAVEGVQLPVDEWSTSTASFDEHSAVQCPMS